MTNLVDLLLEARQLMADNDFGCTIYDGGLLKRIDEALAAHEPEAILTVGDQHSCGLTADFPGLDMPAQLIVKSDEPPVAHGDICDQMAAGAEVYGDPATLGYKR